MPPPGSRAAMASIRRARGEGGLLRESSSRGERSGTSFRRASTRSSAASPSTRRCAGMTAGCVTHGPFAGSSRSSTRTRCRARILSAIASRTGRWTFPPPGTTRRAYATPASSPLPARGASDPRSASRRMERPRRSAGRGRPPGGVADRPGKRLRSALPRCSSRCRITAMQSHQRYFPLEGNRFAFVANGGDPDVVRAGTRKSWRTGWTTPLSASSATSRSGSTAWRSSRGHLVLRRRRHVRRQGRAFAEARRAARWGRGDARSGAPGEGGPGLGARARVPGARGPHRCRIRAPGGISRGRLRRHRRAIPA